jgi:hypothetical protein
MANANTPASIGEMCMMSIEKVRPFGRNREGCFIIVGKAANATGDFDRR